MIMKKEIEQQRRKRKESKNGNMKKKRYARPKKYAGRSIPRPELGPRISPSREDHSPVCNLYPMGYEKKSSANSQQRDWQKGPSKKKKGPTSPAWWRKHDESVTPRKVGTGDQRVARARHPAGEPAADHITLVCSSTATAGKAKGQQCNGDHCRNNKNMKLRSLASVQGQRRRNPKKGLRNDTTTDEEGKAESQRLVSSWLAASCEQVLEKGCSSRTCGRWTRIRAMNMMMLTAGKRKGHRGHMTVLMRHYAANHDGSSLWSAPFLLCLCFLCSADCCQLSEQILYLRIHYSTSTKL